MNKKRITALVLVAIVLATAFGYGLYLKSKPRPQLSDEEMDMALAFDKLDDAIKYSMFYQQLCDKLYGTVIDVDDGVAFVELGEDQSAGKKGEIAAVFPSEDVYMEENIIGMNYTFYYDETLNENPLEVRVWGYELGW